MHTFNKHRWIDKTNSRQKKGRNSSNQQSAKGVLYHEETMTNTDHAYSVPCARHMRGQGNYQSGVNDFINTDFATPGVLLLQV